MTIKYTPDHEWLKVDGDAAVVGITHHAQDTLGDVVGVRSAELLEMPLMAAVVVLAARHVVRRFELPPRIFHSLQQ